MTRRTVVGMRIVNMMLMMGLVIKIDGHAVRICVPGQSDRHHNGLLPVGGVRLAHRQLLHSVRHQGQRLVVEARWLKFNKVHSFHKLHLELLLMGKIPSEMEVALCHWRSLHC